MISLTPVLFVEKIETSLDFWQKGLGFERTIEVPGEGGLAFVMLAKDAMEVMYQTYPSLEEDLPTLADEIKAGRNFLYLKVESLDEVIKKLEGFDVAVERRQTFYGSDEIGYREPSGHFVIFAEFKDQQ